MPRKTPANPPPRPPRRISANPSSEAIPQSPPSAHSTSQSLSSLAALSPPSTYLTMDTPSYVPGGANVSRAQSLRAQAKHSDLSGLGRSSSMKAAGEVGASVTTEQTGLTGSTIDRCTLFPAQSRHRRSQILLTTLSLLPRPRLSRRRRPFRHFSSQAREVSPTKAGRTSNVINLSLKAMDPVAEYGTAWSAVQLC